MTAELKKSIREFTGELLFVKGRPAGFGFKSKMSKKQLRAFEKLIKNNAAEIAQTTEAQWQEA